jgi:hypothetical protein
MLSYREWLCIKEEEIVCSLFLHAIKLLTGGSLVTDGRVTKKLQKEKLRSNNSNDGS